MEKLLGNAALTAQWDTLFQHDHVPQAILLTGETGLGKKTAARALATRLLCPAHTPCATCKSCHMMEDHVHPDYVEVAHAGKRGGFSMDAVREVIRSLALPPNEGVAKCIVFGDCDAMDARAQNLLLKAVEEPPSYVYFIFTAESSESLLPTMRSRMAAYTLAPLSEQACREELLYRGYAAEDVEKSLSAFHGNLGRCVDYLEKPEIAALVALTSEMIYGIIDKNEYALLRTANGAAQDRASVRLFLILLDRCVRDAAAKKADSNAVPIGCCAEGSQKLARHMTYNTGMHLHLAVQKAFEALEANVNVSLLLTALCGDLMDA